MGVIRYLPKTGRLRLMRALSRNNVLLLLLYAIIGGVTQRFILHFDAMMVKMSVKTKQHDHIHMIT